MVVIHVKSTELDQFLFETTCAEVGDALIRKLVRARALAVTRGGCVRTLRARAGMVVGAG